ncbi:hypothetical protein MLD38_030422 [Melastoma candidum]|uniref:Uncharacterized protein n=1 Tax=Melastoma candidum TaxID=119954 RepID=A0ACB9MNP8_9MYRT|nr:hypothetical protein MLD38_030422 [Melastoma candidum]
MGDMGDAFCGMFDGEEFVDTNFIGPVSPDDMFRMFDGGFDEDRTFPPPEVEALSGFVEAKGRKDEEGKKPGEEVTLKRKREKSCGSGVETEEDGDEGNQRMSHIAVERNRRKQMNENLSILRSIMPCFYVKRGDQASIIGGVVDYISELQQVLQSLEAKKQRKAYSEVLSPRPSTATAPPLLSPRKPPLSPRVSLPLSPRTPQPPTSPYKPPLSLLPIPPSPTSSSASVSSSIDNQNILGSHDLQPVAANSKSEVADVEVRFSGANLVLRTVSPRIPGQALKIIAALGDLSLEILHVHICPVDKTTMVNSFIIKIGIECQLSAEELALLIQQTFL